MQTLTGLKIKKRSIRYEVFCLIYIFAFVGILKSFVKPGHMPQVQFEFDQRLDITFLNSIYEGDTEHAALVFGQYLQDLSVTVDHLKVCYQSGNPESLRQAVHKAKPVFSYVGLTELSQKMTVLEQNCSRAVIIADIGADLNAVLEEIQNTRPLIVSEWDRLKQSNL